MSDAVWVALIGIIGSLCLAAMQGYNERRLTILKKKLGDEEKEEAKKEEKNDGPD